MANHIQAQSDLFVTAVGTKVCSCCRVALPLDLFCKDKSHSDGRAHSCRACRAADWAKKNPKPPPLPDGLKLCTTCGEIKPISEFNKHKSGKNGLHSSCRSCLTIKMQNWRSKNPEKAKNTRRAHYEKNKDYVLAQAAAYRLEHLEEEHINRLAHYQRNKDKVAADTNAYRIEHPDLYACAAAKRRASKRNATPAWANLSVIAEIYAECARITQETGILHEVDHIIPIQGETVSGLHCEYNLQIITRAENRSKRNHHWPDMWSRAANKEMRSILSQQA